MDVEGEDIRLELLESLMKQRENQVETDTKKLKDKGVFQESFSCFTPFWILQHYLLKNLTSAQEIKFKQNLFDT